MKIMNNFLKAYCIFFPQKNNLADPADQHGSAKPRYMYKLEISVITSVMSKMLGSL